MSEPLQLFELAGQMARHAGARQSLIARNVANADTPGYVAREMPRFSEVYRSDPATQMRRTRAGHVAASGGAIPASASITATEPSPNGNSVSIEEQMLQAIDASREHKRAVTIYRHGLTILRSALGRS